jgi:hypothetical protein
VRTADVVSRRDSPQPAPLLAIRAAALRAAGFGLAREAGRAADLVRTKTRGGVRRGAITIRPIYEPGP